MEARQRDRAHRLLGLVAFAAALTCVHAVRPTASYRTLELGGGAAEVGVIAASYASLSALAALPLGSAIDRVGPRTFLLGGIATLGTGAALSAFAPSILVLGVAQGLLGLGQVSATISFQSVQARNLGLARDAAFARLAVAGSIGQTLGPLLAGVTLQLGVVGAAGRPQTAGTFLTALGLAVVSLLIVTRVRAATGAPVSRHRDPRDAVPVRALLRQGGMPQALTASIAVLTAIDLLIAYLPVLGEERGVSPGVVGALLSLRAASAVASRLTMTRMIRRLGRRRLLGGAMAVGGLSMLGIATIHPVSAMGLLVAVVGFGLGIGTPMTAAWVAGRAPEQARAKALAVRMTGNRTGQVLVPAAVGGVAGVLGPASVFVIVAGCLLTSSAWVHHTDMDSN